jgi:hypothetical protein
MTIEDLLAHADRLEADLRHKRREINGRRMDCPYTRETLLRQCSALEGRVSEIRRQCADVQSDRAAIVGVAPAV